MIWILFALFQMKHSSDQSKHMDFIERYGYSNESFLTLRMCSKTAWRSLYKQRSGQQVELEYCSSPSQSVYAATGHLLHLHYQEA